MFFIGIFILLLYIIMILSTYLFHGEKTLKNISITSLVVTCTGIIFCIVIPIVFNLFCAQDGLTDEKNEWAQDAFYLFYWYSIVFTLVIMITTSAAAFIKNKYQPIREWCVAAAMGILILATFAYAYTVKDDTINVSIFVYIVSYSEILSMFACFAADNYHIRKKNIEIKLIH